MGVRIAQDGPKLMEAWSSLVYGTGLENRRIRNSSVSSNLTASTIFRILAANLFDLNRVVVGSNPTLSVRVISSSGRATKRYPVVYGRCSKMVLTSAWKADDWR